MPPVPPQSQGVWQSQPHAQEGNVREKWPREGWDVRKQGQAKRRHILCLRKNVLSLGLNGVSTPPSGGDRAGFTALTNQTSVEGTGPGPYWELGLAFLFLPVPEAWELKEAEEQKVAWCFPVPSGRKDQFLLD